MLESVSVPCTCDRSMATLVVVPPFLIEMVKLSEEDTPDSALLILALVTSCFVEYVRFEIAMLAVAVTLFDGVAASRLKLLKLVEVRYFWICCSPVWKRSFRPWSWPLVAVVLCAICASWESVLTALYSEKSFWLSCSILLSVVAPGDSGTFDVLT